MEFVITIQRLVRDARLCAIMSGCSDGDFCTIACAGLLTRIGFPAGMEVKI